MDDRAQKIQALLFAEGGALTFKSLAKSLECSENDLVPALAALREALEGSGLALVVSDTEASLVVSREAREAVAKKIAEEYERDIGDAGLEVLAVVLYEGPSTRATVDYIRGVNSSSTIRNLLARGLLERAGNPADGREYIYRPTVALLAHLGATSRDKLPEYGTISGELTAFKAAQNHGGDEPNIAGKEE